MKGNHFWDEDKRRSFLKLARYCKRFKDILPDKDPYHNRGSDQMRKKGGVRNSSACGQYWSRSHIFHLSLIQFLYFFSHDIILRWLSVGNKKPTDFQTTFRFNWHFSLHNTISVKWRNQTENSQAFVSGKKNIPRLTLFLVKKKYT